MKIVLQQEKLFFRKLTSIEVFFWFGWIEKTKKALIPINLQLYFLPLSTFNSYECPLGNKSQFEHSARLRDEEFQDQPIINWDAILWVNRPTELWAVQLLLAMISLTEALLIAYLSYKVRYVVVTLILIEI